MSWEEILRMPLFQRQLCNDVLIYFKIVRKTEVSIQSLEKLGIPILLAV